jgi:hypothetical protein
MDESISVIYFFLRKKSFLNSSKYKMKHVMRMVTKSSCPETMSFFCDNVSLRRTSSFFIDSKMLYVCWLTSSPRSTIFCPLCTKPTAHE